MGATNALRTLGPGPGLGVLAVDLGKGICAVTLMRGLLGWAGATPGWTAWAVALAGLAALVGHSRSVFLGFTGGKSAATGLGVLAALAWPVALGAAAVVAVVLAVWRIMSLASMAGAVAAVGLVWMLETPLPTRLLVTVGAVYVVARHRANVRRLLAGMEPRVGAG
ncbi:glycerol-3-phosphate acyltransferase [Phenylobacterium sp. J367]|uniref:glycerol-3-phosphate acyltransferase n=1 Tax=Phenylobacterium sp. J367 TaxID=2898435 RepID=UPI002150F973|nr:glycerol-3-phosphate acyltransferase [Phenylobacterium sp. J367]MCR5879151.1 glycerol-3-phosphate acyltransferase [Phenylobacterium sp. J367]